MDKRYTIILAAGLVACLILFFINIYLGGIAAIILVVLAMSFFIMQDSRFHPDISIFLRDDAKSIIVTNRGNDIAKKIHVAIVPFNLEFDIPSLAADEKYEYALTDMISEAKATANYQNSQGFEYSETFRLSALGNNDDDLLKPLFPLFKWK